MMRAVLFDLYGTLVNAPPVEAYDAYAHGTASRLGVDPVSFREIYDADYEGRQTGSVGTHEQYLASLASRLNVELSYELRSTLVDFRLKAVRAWLVVKPDAVAVLAELKARGFLLGLVSDCGWETGFHWPSLAVAPLIDAPVLSYTVGVKKPHPRIFTIACERLDVRPEDCTYVGDGGSNELQGAARAGMHPILIEDPTDAAAHRPGFVPWSGPRITSLTELLERPELAGPARP